jgi:membrane protease subunit (stomatin/prohibitin family)
VWFVNKLTNLDVRWGTPNPIQLLDPRYKIMVQVRAFGQYGIRVTDSKRFLLKLVGSVSQFDVDTLSDYFRGVFITRIKTEIARLIIQQEQSILEVSTQLEPLSTALKQSLQDEVAEYGVTLVQFNVHSINVPEDDPAAVTLKAALAKKAEMGIVGFTYQQERSFDVMQTAAGNEGSAGAVMGAGLGAGMGLGVGASLGQAYNQMASEVRNGAQAPSPAQATPPAPPPSREAAPIDTAERIRLLRELATLRTDGVLSEDEFQAEKKKLLGS